MKVDRKTNIKEEMLCLACSLETEGDKRKMEIRNKFVNRSISDMSK